MTTRSQVELAAYQSLLAYRLPLPGTTIEEDFAYVAKMALAAGDAWDKHHKGRRTVYVSSKTSNEVIGAVCREYRAFHPRARPQDSAKSRRLIAARLGEGFTQEDLVKAIGGCHVSPWHCGENEAGQKYQTLDLIMRDADHVQKFIEIHDNPPKTNGHKNDKTANAADKFLSRFTDEEIAFERGSTLQKPLTLEGDS